MRISGTKNAIGFTMAIAVVADRASGSTTPMSRDIYAGNFYDPREHSGYAAGASSDVRAI